MKLSPSLSKILAKSVHVEPSDTQLGLLPDIAPEALRELLPDGFNPSWATYGDRSVLAIRKSNTETAIIESKGPLFGKMGTLWSPESTSVVREIRTREGLAPIRDIRFFRFREEIWHTFNTGHPRSINDKNDIFLGPLSSLEEATTYRAVFPERHRVEKNWAFFEIQGDLVAIYSVDPFRFIVATHIDDHSKEIHFVDKFDSESGKIALPKKHEDSVLSIGSQPVLDGDTVFLTVHEKPYRLGKFRPYFPRILQFQLRDRSLADYRLGPMLYHSEENLRVGSSINPFAFGVTYASGLDVVDGEVILGYGIADKEYRFVNMGKP